VTIPDCYFDSVDELGQLNARRRVDNIGVQDSTDDEWKEQRHVKGVVGVRTCLVVLG